MESAKDLQTFVFMKIIVETWMILAKNPAILNTQLFVKSYTNK